MMNVFSEYNPGPATWKGLVALVVPLGLIVYAWWDGRKNRG